MSYQKRGTLPPAAAAAIREAIRLADDDPLAAIAAVRQHVEIQFIGRSVELMALHGLTVNAAAGILNITKDSAEKALNTLKGEQHAAT